jgi:hypothetical protein
MQVPLPLGINPLAVINNIYIYMSCLQVVNDVYLDSKSHQSRLIQFALQQKHCNSVKVSTVLHITLIFIGQM